MSIRNVLLTLTLAGLSACSGKDTGRRGGAVRDSAGIRIVELLPPGPEVAPRVLVLDTTWLAPGDAALGEQVTLDVAPDGRVAVLDGAAPRLFVLSAGGAEEASFGRAGQGPGELDPRILRWLVATDSSVVVPDLYQQRVSEFALDGRLLDVRPFPGEAGSVAYAVDWRRHPRGGLVYRVLGEAGDVLVHWHGEGLDTLFAFEPTGAPPNTLLEPTPVWDVTHDGALVLGRSDVGEVRMARPEGAWITRLPGSPGDALTADQKEHLEEVLLATVERQGGGGMSRADLLAQVHFPARAPVIADLRAAPDGSVWVRLARDVLAMDQEVLRVGTAQGFGGADWLVLDGDGTLREKVRLPDRFSVRRFRDRWIYGFTTDELGVPMPGRVAWR